MNLKLLNNENTVITLLDVCGSCITDIIYNFLYDQAILIHNKTSKGLSVAYREVLTNYISESNTPKFYTVLLNTLHDYVRISTVFNTISYPDCISLYASLFVPRMYVNSMTAEQKLNILTMVLGNSIREFCDKVMKQHIVCIIDDHQDITNIEILQDCILQILMIQRKGNYDKFIESQQDNDVLAQQVNIQPRTIVQPKQVPQKTNKKQTSVQLNKLTDAFKKSVAKKMAIEKKNKLLMKKNKQLLKQSEELKMMLLNQIKVHKEQTHMIDELKKQLISTTKQSQNVQISQLQESYDSDVDNNDDESMSVKSAKQTNMLDDMFDIEYTDN